MDLSIIILFCDKDFCFLDDKLKELKQKVKLSYEVLLLDNREKNKTPLIFKDKNVKLFSYGKNYYNYSRHTLVKKATGKYIWFIDVDDNIFEVSEDFKQLIEQNEKKYCFSFITDENPEIEETVASPIWSMWLRADLAKERLKKLNLVPICFFDDDIICAQFDDLEAKRVNYVIYKYNTRYSTFAKKDRFFSLEEIKKFFNIEAIEKELILTNKLYMMDNVVFPGIRGIFKRVKLKEKLGDYVNYFKNLDITDETRQKFSKEIFLLFLQNNARVDKIVSVCDRNVRS